MGIGAFDFDRTEGLAGKLSKEKEEAKQKADEAAYMEKRIAYRREIAQNTLWDSYLIYYSFTELCELAELFYEESVPDTNPAVCRMKSAVYIAEMVLQNRFKRPEEAFAWHSPSADYQASPAQIDSAVTAARCPGESDQWQFSDVIRFTFFMEKQHIRSLWTAGFRLDEMANYKNTFLKFESGNGFCARQLFDVLAEFGFHFMTLLEQRSIVDLVKDMDVDKTGTISFEHLLQIIRVLMDRRAASRRRRQHALIVLSGMSCTECEDWHSLYENVEGCSEGSGVAMQHIRALFAGIGVTWNKLEEKKLTDWLKETSEQVNARIGVKKTDELMVVGEHGSGEAIDFGMFCNLVQRMWHADFAGIMTKTLGSGPPRKSMHHRRRSSLDPSTYLPGTWTAQILVNADTQAQSICRGHQPEAPQSDLLHYVLGPWSQ